MLSLKELADETLVDKNRRLRQEKCRHEEIYSSTVRGPFGTFTNSFCLDCGKSFRMENKPMRQVTVTAYESEKGSLYKTPREAIEADFIELIRKVWGQMPSDRNNGDPVCIARILASEMYESSKVQLRDAIRWHDEQIAALKRS